MAFETRASATIVLLGPHDNTDPDTDVYTQLYKLANIPIPVGKRTKPSCCDNKGNPPFDNGLVDELVDSIRTMAKSQRRWSQHAG